MKHRFSVLMCVNTHYYVKLGDCFTIYFRIQASKALVQKVFGPKFDAKFPASRREAKGDCPSGVWPTTTNGHYHTTGVDLTLGRGQTVSTLYDSLFFIQFYVLFKIGLAHMRQTNK